MLFASIFSFPKINGAPNSGGLMFVNIGVGAMGGPIAGYIYYHGPTETHTDGDCPSEPVSLGTHTELNSEHLLKHLSVHSLHSQPHRQSLCCSKLCLSTRGYSGTT